MISLWTSLCNLVKDLQVLFDKFFFFCAILKEDLNTFIFNMSGTEIKIHFSGEIHIEFQY